MVTYCISGVMVVLGLAGVAARTPQSVGFGLVWVILGVVMALGERRHARWVRDFEAERVAREFKHNQLMARLDEQTKRARERLAQAAAEHQAYLDANFFFQIVVPRADVTPMDETKEAAVRQEFHCACESFLQTLKS
jgi:hypothetical protein